MRVMAVTFTKHGRLHHVTADDGAYAVGDAVLVETDGGPEVATVMWAPEEAYEDPGEIPRCVGLATRADLDRDEHNRRRRAEARVLANRLIRLHRLPMKVVGVDWLDRSDDYDQMAVIYFTAPGRVDFRALVGELARGLRARIDLRHVGARDETRISGGIGSCGRDLCCSTFLREFEPISARMAKDQGLPTNPLRIAGACGKLMCCLKYEHPLYQEFAKTAPAVGERVVVDGEEATVVGHVVPADEVVLRMSATGEVAPCSHADACSARRAYETRGERRKPRHKRGQA
ncbi:stage 0 sporulation family protein [Mariniluteicoccus endophyticus]